VIPSRHLYFLPSHGNGPGPRADDAVRAAWARARVLVEEFAFEPRWIEPLVGRVEDLGGGAWRIVGDAPAWIGKERRKYLVNGRYLAKFAGLGAYGREMLDKARRLRRTDPARRGPGQRISRQRVDRRDVRERSRRAARRRPPLPRRRGEAPRRSRRRRWT